MLRRKGLGEAELPAEPRISRNPRPGSVCRLSSTKLLFSELASAAGTLGPGAQATSRGHITLTEVTGARAWAGLIPAELLFWDWLKPTKIVACLVWTELIPSHRLMTPGSRTGGNNGNIDRDTRLRPAGPAEDNDWDGDKVSACHPGIVAN